MFGDVIYSSVRNTYESVYKAKDERTAAWIADQYDDIGLKEEMLTMIFAYKRDVVLSSKSEEIANELRDKLNHELAAIMTGIQEIDSDYKIKRPMPCELNNIRLRRR